jgi:Transposase IS116/IS110/IS902 family
VRALEADIDRLLDEHGTTLRDEPGIGPINAATLLAEVGDPFRFAIESKFARWCGAVALSSGEGRGMPVRHRLDFGGNRRINSVLYIASVTQQRDVDEARVCIDRKTGEGKTRREARRHTSGTSPTGSSDACGKTKNYASISPIKLLLDKGASDSPLGTAFDFRCECF